ncbi:MAG: hypothetical protein A2513_10705 [Sulfurimonas sp. RIFOXYD12_FULL_33_39]|uniref:DUF523 domain-containing protein n=1 Tax=unclassified Sulfurimonas TaxID=2623549 RepID=UPI0008C294AE|nr:MULTISPECIES: DUF523 domain-containing protein [unclassified Sulfurimonas]OHE06885.1 MAG: hypothetical protein A3G74_01915 [Sulfurimonas sp. RIFCSPLOWO2_12_FULL_34_6]OHE09776.1 MAG: hypothetical protein A2513_10705 [Sulfurimonas sp. RIFOXYD12_FULL_33_39]OHE13716.1 MAG: hypothetical protein A2530_09050 [Sulfurimonas sp. RIFOXYD2_FULL_34_21]DAB28069.1 MAG TPA: hypothetical protein CFH78_04200 [Sulfurimonas sp. UBA10385]
MSSKKVIISACLLGENCRYDGKTKKVNEIVEAFKEYEIIPFCPESPIFGTPRERINVVEVNGKNRIVTDETNIDVTKLLEDEINSFIKSNPKADAIVLKSKSPSCGVGTTPILSEKKEIIKFGNGLAAEIFLNRYKGIKIEDELNFDVMNLRNKKIRG